MKRALLVLSIGAVVLGCRANSELTPRGYPCDAGFGPTDQCPGEWVCGHEGFCVSGDAAEPRACANDTECGGGWHCGPPPEGSAFGTCYDRSVATDVPCRRELGVTGGDCRDGWRCGLGDEPSCYDPATAGAVQCEDDKDCAPNWRCSITVPRVCADATSQLLTGTVSPSILPEIVGPVATTRFAPNSYASYSYSTDFGPVTVSTWIAADGGQWEPEVDGGGKLTLAAADAIVYPSNGNPLVLAGGQLWLPNGTSVLAAGTHLTFKHRDYPEWFYAATWSDTQVTVVSGNGRVPTQTIDGPGKPIKKIVLIPDQLTGNNQPPGSIATYSLLALTDDGVFYAYHNGATLSSTWIPISWPEAPNNQCPNSGADGGIPVLDLETAEGDTYTFYNVYTITGDAPRARWRGMFSYQRPTGCDTSAWNTIFGGSMDCPAGEVPTRLLNLTEQWAAVDCRGSYPDGGIHNSMLLSPADNVPTAVLGPLNHLPSDYVTNGSINPTYYSSHRTNAPGPIVDSSGRLLGFEEDTTTTPHTFSLAPRYFAGEAKAAIEIDGGLHVVDGYVTKAAPNGTVYRDWETLGMRPLAPDEPRTCAAIAGLPTAEISVNDVNRLSIVSLEQLGKGLANGVLEGSEAVTPYVCAGPFRRVYAELSTGNRPGSIPWIVVAAGDRLWAARTSDLDPAGFFPASVPVVAVPSPSLLVDSFKIVEGDASSPDLLTAYALVHERLYRIRAETETRWTSEALDVPAGRPLAVIDERGRARLGFESGIVTSLPGLVPLSPTISTPVRHYATLCDRIYAATDTQLFRLDSVPGSTVGSWTEVVVPTSRLASTSRYGKALFYSVGDHMYVIDDQGAVAKLTDETCGQ